MSCPGPGCYKQVVLVDCEKCTMEESTKGMSFQRVVFPEGET